MRTRVSSGNSIGMGGIIITGGENENVSSWIRKWVAGKRTAVRTLEFLHTRRILHDIDQYDLAIRGIWNVAPDLIRRATDGEPIEWSGRAKTTSRFIYPILAILPTASRC